MLLDRDRLPVGLSVAPVRCPVVLISPVQQAVAPPLTYTMSNLLQFIAVLLLTGPQCVSGGKSGVNYSPWPREP